MPETEKHKEEERLKEVEVKFQQYMEKIKEARNRFYKTSFRLKKFHPQVLDKVVPTSKRRGANPTIVSYNARAVKICNATSSLVRFENKNFPQI
jgi:hypothetical protein